MSYYIFECGDKGEFREPSEPVYRLKETIVSSRQDPLGYGHTVSVKVSTFRRDGKFATVLVGIFGGRDLAISDSEEKALAEHDRFVRQFGGAS